MPTRVIVDCASGAETTVDLTAQEVADLAIREAEAKAETERLEAERLETEAVLAHLADHEDPALQRLAIVLSRHLA